MPKLSIVVPVYNVERYLAKCLDSIIVPGLSDYEIILINDGSTDSSPEICRKYADKNPGLIRCLSTENQGLGEARNTGIGMAQGEYIMFIDSDDSLADNALKEIFAILSEDFDIFIFDDLSVSEAGKQLAYNKACDREGVFSLREYPQLLFAPSGVCACAKVFRRSLFAETGIKFPARLWFEDICTIPKLYIHAEKIIYRPMPWYLYLIRQGSITNSRSMGRNSDIITAMDMLTSYYKEQGKFDEFRDELEYLVFYNELITSSTRVNLIDRKSELQDELIAYFLKNFPDYKNNPYIQNMGGKLKLLHSLIMGRRRLTMNLIMNLNNKIKKKY